MKRLLLPALLIALLAAGQAGASYKNSGLLKGNGSFNGSVQVTEEFGASVVDGCEILFSGNSLPTVKCNVKGKKFLGKDTVSKATYIPAKSKVTYKAKIKDGGYIGYDMQALDEQRQYPSVRFTKATATVKGVLDDPFNFDTGAEADIASSFGRQGGIKSFSLAPKGKNFAFKGTLDGCKVNAKYLPKTMLLKIKVKGPKFLEVHTSADLDGEGE